MSWCCRRRGDAGRCPHRGAAGRCRHRGAAGRCRRRGRLLLWRIPWRWQWRRGGRQPQIRCQRREFDILCQNLPVHVRRRQRAVFRRVVVRDARQLAADVDAKACGRQGFAGRVAPRARRPTEDTAFSGAAVPHLPLQKSERTWCLERRRRRARMCPGSGQGRPWQAAIVIRHRGQTTKTLPE